MVLNPMRGADARASAVATLAAVVTAGMLVWQTRTTVSDQAVLQLLGFWKSDVLDFFETLAFLNVIDPEQTYQIFFEPMANYYYPALWLSRQNGRER
jgi:hypothetical protein